MLSPTARTDVQSSKHVASSNNLDKLSWLHEQKFQYTYR